MPKKYHVFQVYAVAAVVGTTAPLLSSPAFGAVAKAMHCSNAPNHLLMLKPSRRAIWLLSPKPTKPLGSPATKVVKLAGSFQPPTPCMPVMTRMRITKQILQRKFRPFLNPLSVKRAARPPRFATRGTINKGYSSPFEDLRASLSRFQATSTLHFDVLRSCGRCNACSAANDTLRASRLLFAVSKTQGLRFA